MPKKIKYVPPFLHISMQSEGEHIFDLTAQKPVMVTAQHFAALVKVHANARKTAIAVTLLEVAKSLLAQPSYETAHIDAAVASLILDELPMQDFTVPPDFPF